MASFKRWTWLERIALVALLGTVVAIVVALVGPFRDSRAESAARLTQVCAPLVRAITHRDEPQDVTVREMLRLKQETIQAAEGIRPLIKDAHGDVRRDLAAVRGPLLEASDRFDVLTVADRARQLELAQQAAAALGATCESPITEADGEIIGRALRGQPRNPVG